MNFKNWLFLRAVCLLAFGQDAFGSSELRVFPWEFVRVSRGTAHVTFDLPCGYQKVGFLYNSPSRSELELGVVAQAKKLACTSLPKRFTERIPSLSLTGVTKIDQYPEQRGRLTIDTPVDLRVIKTASGRHPQLVLEPKCGMMIGMLIDTAIDGSLRLAAVESKDESIDGAACDFRQEVEVLNRIVVGEPIELIPLSLHRTNLTRVFKWRMLPAHAMPSATGIRFSYQRSCHQAPLGPVITAPVGADKKTVRVGFLVADYYNMPCDGSHQPALEQWEGPILMVKHDVRFEAMTADNGEDLLIRAPSRFGETKNRNLVFDYIQGCGKTVGALYARDWAGQISIGIVTVKGNGTCRMPIKRDHLTQVIESQSVADISLYPLRVRGRL